MTLTNQITKIVADLAALRASDDLFNPYRPEDDPAAGIRRDNLTRHLTAMLTRGTPYLMVAEAPGYRGCRWTGIPVMSERIMLQGIEKWGLLGEGYEATSDVPNGVAEATPTILWGAAVKYLEHPPMVWECGSAASTQTRQSRKQPHTARCRTSNGRAIYRGG